MADQFETEWREYCAQHGEPDRVELMLCDINAVLRGKWLPGSEIGKLIGGSVRLPLSTYAPNIFGAEVEASGLGISVGDPDGVLTPVAGSLAPVPWADGNVAQVLVEMTDDGGQISTISPRARLAANVQQLADLDLYPVVATELEFYIVRARQNADDPPQPPDRLPDTQNYDLEVLARKSDILGDILTAAQDQGLPTDTLIAEYGPGQFEINFHHTDDVLRAADTALLFRRLVRGVVANHGFEATFMAKPYACHPGSGMHVHVSLLDGKGGNIFAGSGDTAAPRLLHAIGGVVETMGDLQAIFAPHQNSFRRFQPNSFAPSSPEWGYDNRAAAVRIPETSGLAARLEHRISGADANPYLVIAAILGGIRHGLENRIVPPAPLGAGDHELAPPLRRDWATAVHRFATSDIARSIFGEAYVAIFNSVRQDEIAEVTSVIAPIEYSTYLSRF